MVSFLRLMLMVVFSTPIMAHRDAGC